MRRLPPPPRRPPRRPPPRPLPKPLPPLRRPNFLAIVTLHVLADYLPNRRWFAAKDDRIGSVGIAAATPLGGKGEVAILSAASTMTNQNSWIEAMKEEWKKPEYKDMPLVATVYGDDQDDKSYREMQGLVKAHPNLKGVISPTTIGIRSGAKAIVDGGLVGKVFITGLGLPSEMKDYVLAGACDTFAIWNPVEYGYSSTMIMADILNGADTSEGAKLSMGKKGETIKTISQLARAELEEFLGRKIHLFLQVKVRPNWLEESERYSEMGLDFKDGN